MSIPKRKTKSDTIWRYMSVAELISISDQRRLVFRQFRSLRRDDTAEGAIPEDLFRRDPILNVDTQAKVAGDSANIDLLHCTYVQCWHRATKENSAFWKIYGERGVAVRTKIRNFEQQSFWKERGLRGEDIVYADTWIEAEKKGLMVPQGITPNRSAMRRKRHAFSWEQEWRMFYQPPTAKYGIINGGLTAEEQEAAQRDWRANWPEYEEIAVDSLKWISEIVVAPAAPKWVFESIASIGKRHSLTCRVSKI